MVGAARGRSAGSGQIGHENVVPGHMKWSATVDPSAVQGIPGVVSENSRPLFVAPQPPGVAGRLSPRQTEVLCFAAAGGTERETALRLGIASATVRGHLARARERLGARSTCPQATSSGLGTCQAVVLAVTWGLVVLSSGGGSRDTR
jgi:DNA-binding CsgD family transcriptional regulator